MKEQASRACPQIGAERFRSLSDKLHSNISLFLSAWRFKFSVSMQIFGLFLTSNDATKWRTNQLSYSDLLYTFISVGLSKTGAATVTGSKYRRGHIPRRSEYRFARDCKQKYDLGTCSYVANGAAAMCVCMCGEAGARCASR